jgi:hypothetical protein
MKPVIATVLALLGLMFSSGSSIARSATDGVIVYNPIDGVTVVTVSTEEEHQAAAGDIPSVNVSNRIVVVVISPDRRFHPRCGIGVPYPWQRKVCGDPLYPF